MKNKKILLLLFVLTVVAQWFVPLQMWQHQKNILKTGKEFKFKTAPIDPTDPFRGKYITLRYDTDFIYVKDTNIQWKSGEILYAKITNDSLGFARIDSVFKHPPKSTSDFIKTKVTSSYDNSQINIEFPFDRYYMEESKAPGAETLLSQQDANLLPLETYAVVSIKNGEGTLKEVFVNEVPINQYVKKIQLKIK